MFCIILIFVFTTYILTYIYTSGFSKLKKSRGSLPPKIGTFSKVGGGIGGE